MKKFVSFVSLTLATLGVAAGCAVDVQDEGADVGAGEEAACENINGVNAMMASLASAIGVELGRWDLVKDFEIYIGYNYQENIRIKQSVRYRCKNSCRNIDALLIWQDSRNDQQFRFKDGTKLNSWVFAARLVAGYRNQQTCESRSSTDVATCKGVEDHFLERTAIANATCGGVDYGLSLYTYRATRGLASGGEANPYTDVPLTYPNRLMRKLVWANNNSSNPNDSPNLNPYLQFAVAADGMSVVIDPGDGTVEEPPPPPATPISILEMCQKYSPAESLVGRDCLCNGVYTTMKVWVGKSAGWHKCQL
jgi:hypothetical protein